MLLQGFIISYDSSTRIAIVQIEGTPLFAKNFLFVGAPESTDLVNNYLLRSEKDTVKPSHTFDYGDIVLVKRDDLENLIVLGKILTYPKPTTPIAPETVVYELGKFYVDKNITVGPSKIVTLDNFANRALVRKIKVTKLTNAIFTVKVYNSKNELQASWGDGEVLLENELTDDAGFFFESYNYSLKLELSEVGDYHIYILGERFS